MEPNREDLNRELEKQNAQWDLIEQTIRSVGPDARFLIPPELLEEIDEACHPQVATHGAPALGAIRV